LNLNELETAMTTDIKSKFGQDIRFWVWPEYDSVKGFYGTGKINDSVLVWITERPSMARDTRKANKFPDWVDKRFYGLLKTQGLANMHFTDFVKIMAEPGKPPTVEELVISASWLRKELDMLSLSCQKKIVIANSRNVAKWMSAYLPEYPCLYHHFFKHDIRYGKTAQLEGFLRKIKGEIE
jgi:hypothetical protein